MLKFKIRFKNDQELFEVDISGIGKRLVSKEWLLENSLNSEGFVLISIDRVDKGKPSQIYTEQGLCIIYRRCPH